MYGLESATERDTYISYAYDLYRNESFFVDIPWYYQPMQPLNSPINIHARVSFFRYNPYRGLTMLHYNPLDMRLYFFDAGKLLSVNVRTDEDEYAEEEEIDESDEGKNEYEGEAIKGGRG